MPSLADNKISVSISHSGDLGGAIACPDIHPMALDIEKIRYD